MPWERAFGKTTGNWKTALSFGTWNVRIFYKPGAVHKIVNEIEKYKIKLTALQEIRWSDIGSMN